MSLVTQMLQMELEQVPMESEQASIVADEDRNTAMDTFFTNEQNETAEKNLQKALFELCPEAELVRIAQKFGITEKSRSISKKKKTTTGTHYTTMSSGSDVQKFLADISRGLEAHHHNPMIQAVTGLAVDDAAAAAERGAEVEVTVTVPPEDEPIYETNMVPNWEKGGELVPQRCRIISRVKIVMPK